MQHNHQWNRLVGVSIGGEVKVDSVPGAGAAFLLKIPVAKQKPQEPVEQQSAEILASVSAD